MFGHTIGVELSGRTQKHGSWNLSSSYAHRFEGPAPRPSRAVWMIGFRGFSIDWSVMLQIYRPGTGLDWHQDGECVHNHVTSFVLLQPHQGGVIEVEGEHKRWWRFHKFDGGVCRHRVTPCGGYRVVFMFQRGIKLKEKEFEAYISNRKNKG